MFGVPWRAGESYVLDYRVTDSEWSQINLHWIVQTRREISISTDI